MKLFLKILNTITIIVLFTYLFLTYQFYSFLMMITNNMTSSIYFYSKIPYYLLWLTVIINIVLNIIVYIRNKGVITRDKIKLPIKSGIFVTILLLLIIIFTSPFEFLYYKEKDSIKQKSIRYDKLFVCNYFYSNKNYYEGGYGDTKYLYIPGLKKIVYIDSTGTNSYDVKYIKKNKVKIGQTIYNIKDVWYNES